MIKIDFFLSIDVTFQDDDVDLWLTYDLIHFFIYLIGYQNAGKSSTTNYSSNNNYWTTVNIAWRRSTKCWIDCNEMIVFNKEIKKNESNHKIHRFGQQDVHVLNKLLISMQISIIFDRISMLNQKKLSIGICVYSRRSFNYWNLLSVYFIHSFLDGHCLTKESNRNYTVHRWSFLL